jgi:hypothetical protein
MWKNKHVVIAMLVAPILAVIAWYGVDSIVAERAQSAEPGSAYPLVARSNCRYESGQCDLVNHDFKLTVRVVDIQPGKTTLALESEFPLASATLSMVTSEYEVLAIVARGSSRQSHVQWIATIAADAVPGAILRVAVTVQQSVYFAEVPVIFINAVPVPELTR